MVLVTDTRDAANERVFGRHEAEAMFEAIGNALAILGNGGEVSGSFLQELKAERAMLVDDRTQVHLALLRDGDNEPGKAVVNALRVLDGPPEWNDLDSEDAARLTA